MGWEMRGVLPGGDCRLREVGLRGECAAKALAERGGGRVMKRRGKRGIRALLALAIVIALTGPAGRAQQKELKSYELHGAPRAGDMSPDEKFVVIEVPERVTAEGVRRSKWKELAQLWDFRADRSAAETVLTGREGGIDWIPGRRFVRFTGDGKLVVVWVGAEVYVLGGEDLRMIRTIGLEVPREKTTTIRMRRRTLVNSCKPKVGAMAVSGTRHWMAVVWDCEAESSQLEVYDLDAGLKLKSWDTKDLGMGILGASGLEWESNGRDLVVVISCSICHKSDVFVVDALSGVIRKKFTIDLSANIAVANDQLWAVTEENEAVFKNKQPKMEIFDLQSGARVGRVKGRESGVRYGVAASADGSRVAAFTGRIKMAFDWGDTVWRNVSVDRTFTVWDRRSLKEVATSQDLNAKGGFWIWGAGRESMRMSAKGTYVMYGTRVYEVE